jgi:hypothetical protein
VLPSCTLDTATATCIADPSCFGFSAATAATGVGIDAAGASGERRLQSRIGLDGGVGSGLLVNCSFHSVGSPTDGGSTSDFAAWTTWVKAAQTTDGAAEACLIGADAVHLVRGGPGGHGLIGRRCEYICCCALLPLVAHHTTLTLARPLTHSLMFLRAYKRPSLPHLPAPLSIGPH